jgi:hypothetical protein
MKEQIIRGVCVFVGLCLGLVMGSWFTPSSTSSSSTAPESSPGIISSITNMVSPSSPSEAVKAEPCVLDPAAANKPVFLGAPKWRHTGAFSSDRNGKVYVTWKESEGAEKYEVKVFDAKGTPIKTFVSERNVAHLEGLAVDPKAPRTLYQVQVTPIGEGAKRGIASEKKDVSMLPMRNLAPPSIKSITTEED